MEGPLDFSMLLKRDYMYAMNVVMFIFFHVMHFSHNENNVTIDQLAFTDPYPHPYLDHVAPLSIYSVPIDTIVPWVNYVASYLMCPIAIKESLYSCLSFWDLTLVVDYVSYPMGELEPLFPSV
jgi:hypothetical protein